MAKIAALVLVAFCLANGAASSEEAERRDPGVIVRNSEVKSAPSNDDDTVASVRIGHQVEVRGFRGQWAHISASEIEQGWVPVANVRLKIAAAQGGGGSPLAGLLRGVTGSVGGLGNQQKQESISAGIRGVQPSDIVGAEPDPEERRKLDDFRASRIEAENHAREAALERRDIAYFER